MSDNYTDDELIQDQDDAEGSDPTDIKSLRRAANSKKKLEQELAEMRRELAFAKAGLDLGDPKMKYFVKGYDGEMSADAVRAAALEAGFLASQASEADQPPGDGGAQQRVMQASAGAISQDNSEAAVLTAMQQALDEGGMDAMLDVARQYGIPIGTEM